MKTITCVKFFGWLATSVLLLSVNSIFSQTTSVTTAFSFAQTGQNLSIAGSGGSWTTTGNVVSDNNSYATVSVVKSKSSDALRGSNFGFSIPSNATITGIEVRIGKFSGSSTNSVDATVQLINTTTPFGSNLAKISTQWGTAEAEASYGGSSNLWGSTITTLTPGLINSADFGVYIVANNTSSGGSGSSITFSVDYIKMSVSYTIPTPTISKTNPGSSLSTIYGRNSTSGTFTVSGSNMLSGITVTAPSGFEVSQDNSTFSGSVIVGSSGTISATTVYVRLSSSASDASYSDNIGLSSTSASNVNVPVSGIVHGVYYYDGNNNSVQDNNDLLRLNSTINPTPIPNSDSYFSESGVRKIAFVVKTQSSSFTLNSIVADKNLSDGYNPGAVNGDFEVNAADYNTSTITSNLYYKITLNTAALKIPSSTEFYNFWLSFTDVNGNQLTILLSGSASALPVTITNFTAKATTDNKVNLAWVTASESNNKGFRIERKAEGESKFNAIGFVASKAQEGTSQSFLAYSFKDLPAPMGSNMYRLVQEDLDGKQTISEVKMVRLNGQSVVSVYPNPTNGTVTINRSNDGKKMNVQILDQMGRIVSQYQNISDSSLRLNLPQSGIYQIKLMYPETGEQSIQRIVVQH